MKPLLIKPHHFLDIIKLYGAGLTEFVPDPDYGHDFYKVGNLVLQQKETPLLLTVGGDAICQPCKHFQQGKCVDGLEHHHQYTRKNDWNRTVDTRLLTRLKLQEEQQLTALQLCQTASELLTPAVIDEIWKEEPADKTILRTQYLQEGFRRYHS